jgi:hypothetical protein
LKIFAITANTQANKLQETLNTVSTRIIPVLNDLDYSTIFAIFHIEHNEYYIIRHQQKGFDIAIHTAELKKCKPNKRLRLVKKWECAPDAIKLGRCIRERLEIKKKLIVVKGNHIMLINGYTEDRFVKSIDRIHYETY